MSSVETFVDHVAGHTGVSADRAALVTRNVLHGIGAYLTSVQREMIAEELPATLGGYLVAGELSKQVAELVEVPDLLPGLNASHARELVSGVCRVLAEELSVESLQVLRDVLPDDIARMLESTGPGVTHHAAPALHGSTIASGRPGSEHPISEARPPEAHQASVAATNPHGATKLSSTPGTLQEREHDTLADGRPGYDAPLAGRRR